MITTRKEYAERHNVSERTVKNHMEALGLDTSKATITEEEVILLDHLRSLINSGCKMAEAVEQVQAIKSAVPAGENPFFPIIKHDMLGNALDAAIPHFPEWTIELLSQGNRMNAIRDAFRQQFSEFRLKTVDSSPLAPPPPSTSSPSLPPAAADDNDPPQ